MSGLIIALLLIGGIILLLLEILVVPGTTVVGVLGFILVAVGIWQSYVIYGVMVGSAVLIVSLGLSLLALYLSLRSKTWNKAMLNTSINSKVNLGSDKLRVGDSGMSISRINPMGKAIFNNEFFEVSSFGGMIDENRPVKVIEIQRNKIYVELEEASQEENKQ